MHSPTWEVGECFYDMVSSITPLKTSLSLSFFRNSTFAASCRTARQPLALRVGCQTHCNELADYAQCALLEKLEGPSVRKPRGGLVLVALGEALSANHPQFNLLETIAVAARTSATQHLARRVTRRAWKPTNGIDRSAAVTSRALIDLDEFFHHRRVVELAVFASQIKRPPTYRPSRRRRAGRIQKACPFRKRDRNLF